MSGRRRSCGLILAAEGRKTAAIQDAEARERLAQAEAAATRMVADAAAAGGESALRYFIADRYVQAFGAIASAPGNRLVIVPMESAALAGGIAQALELLKPSNDVPRQATMGPPPAPRPQPPTVPPAPRA